MKFRENDTKIKILSIDDDLRFSESLKSAIADDFDVTIVGNASEALSTLKIEVFDCILLDMNLPEFDGLRLLKMIKGLFPAMPVIMLTGDKTPEKIVRAIKEGASDYVIKEPKELALELKFKITKAVEQQGLLSKANDLEKKVSVESSRYEIKGFSTSILALKEEIIKLRGRNVPVMITGESGTGKELVARTLNLQEAGGLSRPFVAVNCSAIPENLAESELFGHTKGAFTGAHQQQDGKFVAANGGDIFLDEIGDLPLPLQAKLLRVLQEREVVKVGSNIPVKINVRVIAATHKNLDDLVAQGKFREDLYYRLVVVVLKTPSLRERKDDIPILSEHFLGGIAPQIKIDGDALESLKSCEWRGNIRALKNCIERAAILALAEGASRIQKQHIILDSLISHQVENDTVVIPADLLPQNQEEVNNEKLMEFAKWSEFVFFTRAFIAMDKNKSNLAKRLALSRDYIHRKLKNLGIGEAT